ncbi:hypothetical protein ACSBR2_000965 [Camellia fascicularis]
MAKTLISLHSYATLTHSRKLLRKDPPFFLQFQAPPDPELGVFRWILNDWGWKPEDLKVMVD